MIGAPSVPRIASASCPVIAVGSETGTKMAALGSLDANPAVVRGMFASAVDEDAGELDAGAGVDTKAELDAGAPTA
jgi:hypothetical protein